MTKALDLPRLSLDHLLGLDAELVDPSEHAVFGVASAQDLALLNATGPEHQLGRCEILGFHRSDDQSQARPGGMDLEFETEEGDLVVDLENYVQKRLMPLVAGWETLVVALCNPDRVELGPWLRPLLQVAQGPVYWAFGEVQASWEPRRGVHFLEAERWFREEG